MSLSSWARFSLAGLLMSSVAGAAPPVPSPAPAAKATPAPVLEGVVVGPDGRPVAQAVLAAWSAGVRFPAQPVLGRTDAAGRFRLVLRERGPHGLRVEAEGFAPSFRERVPPSGGLRIALGKGIAIEGVVRDGPTGIAVAGAVVEARDDRGRDALLLWEAGAGTSRAVTDGQGRYKVQGLGTGLHTVSARARGFGQAERRAVPAGGRADLILYPAGALGGVVRGPDGRPVAGARVVVEPGMRFFPASRVETTNREGRFEFTALEPGGYRLVARHKDFAVAWVPVTVERQADAEASLTLDPPLAVMGRLVDGADRPTRGRVVVSEAAGSAVPVSMASTYTAEVGTDGRFRIALLPGGSAVLSATAPGFGARRVEVELSPARAETDLGAVALETGLTISGRVRDKAGQPIPDARISGQLSRPMMAMPFTNPETVTEADGRFVLGGLEPGRYDLSVQAPGFGFARRDADAGAENVEIVAQPGGSLTGTVVDENRQPVPSFRVNVRPVQRFTPGQIQIQASFRLQTIESAEGRFVLDDLAPAEYTVQVFATDREPASVSSVAVPAGGTADVGQLRVGPGGLVRGTVVDAAGAAVGGASVRSQGPGSSFLAGAFPETATDATGAFELRGLAAGSLRLIASHPLYATAQVTVDVEPGKDPAEARLVLSQGGRIEGRARKRDGTPVAGMINAFSRTSGMMMSGNPTTPIGADGAFAMDHVPAGRLTLSLMLGSGPRFEGSQNQEVEVRDGETTTVEFVLRDILITGRVTRGGTPAPGLRVTVQPQSMTFMSFAGPSPATPAGGPQRLRALTREDGSYELLIDQPGTANFSVESADGSLQLPRRPVEIPDAERHVVDLDYAGLATVAGVVVDEEGETPLSRATVIVSGSTPSMAQTGEDGRFQLELEPGEYQVHVRLQGYAHTPEPLTVSGSGLSDLRLVLGRGGIVKGRVVDAAGRPRPSTFVHAFVVGPKGPTMSGGVAMTLPDGTFEMSGLSDGASTLLARSETGEFAVAPGIRPGREGLTLTLRRGGRVQVRVLGPDGAPLPGAFATVTSVGDVALAGIGGRGRSDADGMIEVEAPAGVVQIRANKENLEGSASTSVGTGAAAPLEVRLAPKTEPRTRP